MTVIERVENAKKLWRLLLPSCPAPDDYQVGRWASRFTDQEIEYAVQRTSTKFRNGAPSSPVVAQRYATGVLLNEQRAKLERN